MNTNIDELVLTKTIQIIVDHAVISQHGQPVCDVTKRLIETSVDNSFNDLKRAGSISKYDISCDRNVTFRIEYYSPTKRAYDYISGSMQLY